MLLETLTQNCCSCLECAVSLLCFGFLFFFSVFFISSIYEICRVCLGGRRACSSWSFLFFFVLSVGFSPPGGTTTILQTLSMT